jgi:hypothetical protein
MGREIKADMNGSSNLIEPNMHKSDDKEKVEIDITADHEWVERIAKTANEICDDPDCNRIQLNGQHTGFVIKSRIGTGTQEAPRQNVNSFDRT